MANKIVGEKMNIKNVALEVADTIVFLVAHKEFKKLNIKTELDFCGVLN